MNHQQNELTYEIGELDEDVSFKFVYEENNYYSTNEHYGFLTLTYKLFDENDYEFKDSNRYMTFTEDDIKKLIIYLQTVSLFMSMQQARHKPISDK